MRDPAIRAIPWHDLRPLSGFEIGSGLLLSLPWLALAIWLSTIGWLVPALLASFVLFLCGLRQAHDAFHNTLGLQRRLTEGFLLLLSVVMMMPLHAVKFNHLRHHARPLTDDDLEGWSARLPGWLAILTGPFFTLRLIQAALWHGSAGLRFAVLAELLAISALTVAAVLTGWFWLGYHVVVMLLGNCLTGFFAVWIVHHDCDPQGLFARTQRSDVVNWMTLHLFYHLEHHLFTAVPSCHLPELARRLDPHLRRAGVRPVRLWF